MSRISWRKPARVVVAAAMTTLALVMHGCISHDVSDVQSVLESSVSAPSPCVVATEPLPIIPFPRQIARFQGGFALPETVTIGANGVVAHGVAERLVAQLRPLGISAVVNKSVSRATIRIAEDAHAPALGPEGYRLSVNASGADIVANTGAGLFYGAQTFEQIASRAGRSACSIPYVRIVDWPQYRWRGIHLDVSRHFFPVEVVERYIDLAARFKLNTFHWHLTDDQGWRIQIQAYPRLTSVGGCRDGAQVGGYESGLTDGVRTCGSYTQQQIRDIVAYAAERYVSIVPEIEGPGHSVEVLAAYPQLACSPGTFSTLTLWGSTKYAVCPTELTFAFYDNVIREVAGLFPSPLIHIGGDEVPYFSWRTSAFVSDLMRREQLSTYSAVQGYFTRRIERIARKYGRRIVGWDEIEAAGVSQNAVVMAWSQNDTWLNESQHGNDVVLTPSPPLYFDAYQGDPRYEPPAIGGFTPLSAVYQYNPVTSIDSPAMRKHILGAQGNVWTEYIPTSAQLWYMVYPRALALAELCWTPRARMNWTGFTARAGIELQRLEPLGIKFRIPASTFRITSRALSPVTVTRDGDRTTLHTGSSGVDVTIERFVPNSTLHYTVDGSPPNESSPVYDRPLHLKGTRILRVIAAIEGYRISAPSTLSIVAR